MQTEATAIQAPGNTITTTGIRLTSTPTASAHINPMIKPDLSPAHPALLKPTPHPARPVLLHPQPNLPRLPPFLLRQSLPIWSMALPPLAAPPFPGCLLPASDEGSKQPPSLPKSICSLRLATPRPISAVCWIRSTRFAPILPQRKRKHARPSSSFSFAATQSPTFALLNSHPRPTLHPPTPRSLPLPTRHRQKSTSLPS